MILTKTIFEKLILLHHKPKFNEIASKISRTLLAELDYYPNKVAITWDLIENLMFSM